MQPSNTAAPAGDELQEGRCCEEPCAAPISVLSEDNRRMRQNKQVVAVNKPERRLLNDSVVH